jgi:hypothetical protein
VIVSPLQVQGPKYTFESFLVTAMILGGAAAGAGQFRSHMIAGVGVESLFQSTRSQAQCLPPCRRLYRFQIQLR